MLRSCPQRCARSVLLLLALGAGAVLRGAPTITQQPSDVSVTSGQNATLTVAAVGAGPLTYQWRRSGFAIPGATNATFVWGGTTMGEAGYYDVLVSDGTGTTRSSVAQLTVAPRAYPTAIAPDPGYALPLDLNDRLSIWAVAPAAAGGYYLGGSLATVGTTHCSLVVRVTDAGELDPTFAPPEITGAWIDAVEEQPDGKVVIGGNFSHIGNVAVRGFARLNADGSLDQTFQDPHTVGAVVDGVLAQPDGKLLVVTNPGFVRCNADGSRDPSFVPAVSGDVWGMALQSDGKVIIVGSLRGTAHGQTFANAIRLNADGSIDPSFQLPAFSGWLQAVAVSGDGSIYVGGSANSADPRLLRLTSTGAIDSAFAADLDGSVSALCVQPDGKIVVGGSFSYVGGVFHPNLARLNHDGSLDIFATASPQAYIRALLRRPDGSIVVGADDTVAALRQGPLRYMADGALAATPNLLMRSVGWISALAMTPGGKIAAVGIFDRAGASLRTTKDALRLNPDGSLDTTIANTSADAGPTNVNQVLALPDGRIAIAGTLDGFMNHPISGVAILHVDGSPDYSFAQSSMIGLCGNSLTLTPAGKIVVGGYIDGPNSATAPGAVAAYNLDGSLAAGFDSGAWFDHQVTQVVAQRDGRILVAGLFSTYRGAPVNPFVRLNADGTLDTAFAANAHVTHATMVQLAPTGQIYVSGDWSGSDGSFAGLFRLNADGTRDTSYRVANSVSFFLLQPDGRAIADVVAGGAYLARFNNDGTADTTFHSFAVDVAARNSALFALLRDDGQLEYAEGEAFANRLRATTTASAPIITTAPTAAVVVPGGSTTLTVAASSVIPLTYQWQYNGAPIAGATHATYTVAGLSAANAGAYNVVVSNQLGSATTTPVAVTAPLDLSGHLVNLSIRATASDTDPLIVGVVLGGTGTGGAKPLLFRAAGPTLTYFGVPGALADPVLELYDGTGFKIDQDDDWTGVFDFASVGAFPFLGTAPKDAAIYNPYATNGAETIHMLGKNGARGVVLGEVYDATPGDAFTVTTPRIINGSARTEVGTGDNALILGFAIAGEGNARLLIRAVGPTLAAAPFDLGGMLADPTVEIHAADTTTLATNDNWSDNNATATMTTAFDSVGAFRLAAGSKDAAVIVTLPPGTYSAVVRGVGGTTGSAMAELYALP